VIWSDDEGDYDWTMRTSSYACDDGLVMIFSSMMATCVFSCAEVTYHVGHLKKFVSF
jgi:hypothetical protein